MTIKIQPPVHVLYSSHQTTLSELHDIAGTIMKDLYAEAASLTMVTGPLSWIYHGMDGKPETVFTLEIALPIQNNITPKHFKTKEVPSFKSVSKIHEGSWETIGGTYNDIIQYVETNRIPMKDECREIFLNIDFERPENNVTEVQIGIA